MAADSARVLFVDDEPRVLQGIARMLHGLSDSWELDTAVSGEGALAKLAHDDYVLVVSDMRMPGMDGAALLALVRARYPGTIRVVLSGQTEPEAASRAVAVAHRFVAKPCRPDALSEIVDRAIRLRAALRDERLRATLVGLQRLPSPARLYDELVLRLQNPAVEVDELCAHLLRDPALVAKVLHIASSSFFFSGATGLGTAVRRLGVRALASLALNHGIFQSAPADAEGEVARNQARSLRAAEIALDLAPPEEREDAFTAALLCDVGKLAVVAAGLGGEGSAGHSANLEAEWSAFGWSHAEIGAYLLELWGLPIAVCSAVANHHRPERIAHSGAKLEALAHVASSRADELEPDRALAAAYGFSPV